MKVFVAGGKVVGYVDGALPEIESNIHIEGFDEVELGSKLATKISDANDPLVVEYLKIDNGIVVEMSSKEIAKVERDKAILNKEAIIRMEKFTQEQAAKPTVEDLQAQIEELKGGSNESKDI